MHKKCNGKMSFNIPKYTKETTTEEKGKEPARESNIFSSPCTCDNELFFFFFFFEASTFNHSLLVFENVYALKL